MLQQEQLLESVELRNKMIQNTSVLDKVKILSMLPNGEHLTTIMIAHYYEVSEEVINMVVKRHRDELELDGMEVASGERLVYIKYTCEMKSNKARQMIIFNRRCVLRIGMLLRDSKVAKQLRTYLLNIEEQATQQQKSKATRGSRWDGKDLILYDRIVVGINEGKTLSQICEEVAPTINETSTACRNRYTQKIKTMISNKELVTKIESNRGSHLRVVETKIEKNDTPADARGIEIPTWAETYLNHVVQMNIETNELIKKANDDLKELTESKISNLEELLQQKTEELKLVKSRNRKLAEELKQTRAVIASAVKIGVNETIQQTFKMSKNGNLERL